MALPAPRWLDRLWLVLIGLSFILIAPLWFALMAERMGFPFVTIAVLAACGHWWYRRRATSRQ